MKQKSIKLNFVMNMVLTMSSFLFPLITFPYISRILVAEGTGKVSFASSLISYFSMFAQLGIPTYGYDWTLPYTKGRKAISLSNPWALSLAAEFRVSIRYDETAQSPWFSYTDCQGQPHEVWFEDARSIRAKLSLAAEYGLAGVGYWNLMRPFPQNWVLLNALYQVQDPPPL